jgi:hypothetical protein
VRASTRPSTTWRSRKPGLRRSRISRCAGPLLVNMSVSVTVQHQLDTKSIERSELSRTAAATLPKNSVSPAGRPTPKTIKL